MLLDSFETCPIGIVSLITQLFFTIRRSILFGNSALDFGIKITDSKDISDDFSIMLNFSIIQNSSGMKFESLPSTLLSYFRTISVVGPDLQHLVRSYLVLMGESNAQADGLTRKFVAYLKFISSSDNFYSYCLAQEEIGYTNLADIIKNGRLFN